MSKSVVKKNNVFIYAKALHIGKHKILLNGEIIGTMKSQETKGIHIPVGEHTLQILNINGKTTPLQLTVSDKPIYIVLTSLFKPKLKIVDELSTLKKVIRRVVLLNAETRRSVTGSMIRESLFGTAAALSSGKQVYTFLIEYTDFTREVKDVRRGSKEFKELIKYLDIPQPSKNESSMLDISSDDIEMFESIDIIEDD
jgi:hypothetical protein